MPTLQQHLAALPYRDLRGIATRLGVSQRGQNRKTLWRTALIQGWRTATQRQTWLAQLSPQAQAALQRLLLGEQMPRALFEAEYGVVRRVTARRHWPTPPWQDPQTPAEELYYAGLLAPADGLAWSKTNFITLPADLRPLIPPPLSSVPLSSAPLSSAPLPPGPLPPASLLCHDIGQLLIYLHTETLGPSTRQRHQPSGWLTRAQLHRLNQRLLHPEPAPLPRSHKQTNRLRNLLFFATAAGLIEAGAVTPFAWAWLGEPLSAQSALLWRGWQTASPTLRHRYAQPDAGLPAPWPAPLLTALRTAPMPFTAPALSAQLLNQDPSLRPYWVAHLADLSDLDQLINATCATTLHALGLVQMVTATPAPVFQITAFGRWLLGEPAAPPEWPSALNPSATLSVTATEWSVTLPANALLAQAKLAPYAHYGPAPAPPTTGHLYQLTPTTVGQAAALGLGLPALAAAFALIALPLTPDHWQQLHAWHQAGRSITISNATLLRTSTPAQLQALTATQTLQTVIGELLSPTTALLQQPPSASAQALQAAGHTVVLPDGPATPATPPSGALWLAGQLYAYLSQQIDLPLPPPFAELHTLYHQLPPAQQALLQSQLTQLQARLLDLLDAFPFTPPPAPSDPAQWTALIQQTIATDGHLQMTYFSAGRNLLTHRLIKPFWLTERGGVLYLVAECHQTNRVLTFRLDRIQSLTNAEWGVGNAE